MMLTELAHMQIFVTSPCPIESARALDNSRVVKMVLESVQIMSAALYNNGAYPDKFPLYYINYNDVPTVYNWKGGPGWKNHPCAIWAGENSANYKWLGYHGLELAQEYKRRYGKHHKLIDLIQTMRLMYITYIPQSNTMTPFRNCTTFKDPKHTNGKTIYEIYRNYLNFKWANGKRKPSWSTKFYNGSKPDWAKV